MRRCSLSPGSRIALNRIALRTAQLQTVQMVRMFELAKNLQITDILAIAVYRYPQIQID